MSEVKRWKLKGFIPGVDGESKAIFQPVVVLAEDFDNVTRLFLDAAERAVASERREKELQQRLTAADERADVLEGLLRSMTESYAVSLDAGYDRITALGGKCDSVQRMLADNPDYANARAALKPAEGGGDEAI